MRTSEAHRYARFSAAAAVLIAVVAGGYFTRRALQAHRAARNAPAPVPAAIEKASQEFSYSKQAGDRTIFTIRASHATQFKGDNRAVLEDVWLTIYGATGGRADNIHTHSCDYDQTSGKIVCAGNVQMDFQSAEDAKRGLLPEGKSQPLRVIHAETQGLSFDRDSGDAWTDQAVTLRFPGGDGSATGVKYHSKDGLIELLHNVKFNLQPSFARPGVPGTAPASTAQAAGAPILLTGSSMQYQRESGVVFLHGPVGAAQSPNGVHRELRAMQLTIELDTQMRARRMTAAGALKAPAELLASGPKGEQSLAADSFFANYSPAGWIQNFRADGHVQTTAKDSRGHTSLSAATLETKMAPGLNAPEHAKASGGVKVDSELSGNARHFESAELNVDFVNVAPKEAGGHAVTYAKHAETPSAALLTWEQPAASQRAATGGAPFAANQSAQKSSKLSVSGRRLEMEFDDKSRLRQLQVHGAAKLDRTDPAGAPQTSTSDELSANLDDAGEWSQLVQSGHVKMHDSLRTAQAQRSHVEHTANTLTLIGAAQVADADSQTSADTIVIDQNSNEMHADGHVVASYNGSASSATAPPGRGRAPLQTVAQSNGASQSSQIKSSEPSHASADHLVANSNTGKALFTGHARLWQGDATIEGDRVELDRTQKQANANGNVRALFVTRASEAGQSQGHSPNSSSQLKPSQPQVWHVHAAHMTYSDLTLLAHLDGGFTADSQQISIGGTTGDLYFVRTQTSESAMPAQGANAAQQPPAGTSLDHATASDHVTVRQGDRHGAGELGQYSAAEQKFTLSGGHPTFTDAAGNTTAGRELTFYLGNDTILVQSEEGTRPQPHHRVEK